MKKKLLIILKLCVAVGLCWWVFSRIDWYDQIKLKTESEPRTGTILEQTDATISFRDRQGRELRTPIAELSLKPVAEAGQPDQPWIVQGLRAILLGCTTHWQFWAAIALFFVPATLIGVRWVLLLRPLNLGITMGRGVFLNYIGWFFNVFLPGTTGGDLVKAYLVMKQTGQKAAPLMSVFVDRALGLGTLVLMGLVAALFSLDVPFVRQMIGPIIVVMVVLFGGSIVMLSSTLQRWLGFGLWVRLPGVGKILRKIQEVMAAYRSRLSSWGYAIAMTVGLQLISITCVLLMGRSAGIDIPAKYFYLFVPLIWVVSALPVSIGGLGLMEGAFQVCFASVGVAPEAGLALALLWRLLMMVSALPGGLFFTLAPKGSLAAARALEKHKP